ILNRAGGNPQWLLECVRSENSEALVKNIHSIIREELSGPFLTLTVALAINRAPASAELLAHVTSLDLGSVRQKLLWLRNIGAVQESNLGFEMRMDGLRSAVVSELSTRTKRT